MPHIRNQDDREPGGLAATHQEVFHAGVDPECSSGAALKEPMVRLHHWPCFCQPAFEYRRSRSLDGDPCLLKGHARLPVCDLRLKTSDLPVTVCDLRLETGDLPVSVSDLRLETNDLPVTVCELRLEGGDLRLNAGDLRLRVSEPGRSLAAHGVLVRDDLIPIANLAREEFCACVEFAKLRGDRGDRGTELLALTLTFDGDRVRQPLERASLGGRLDRIVRRDRGRVR